MLLRRHDNSPDGYIAVTYVPDKAPVRQKMLFAATRLTLVRELGTERFRETYFTTVKEELTAQGWRKHEKHTQMKAPLTEEEQTLQGIKEAEAEASRGTGHRASHLSGHTTRWISEEGLRALKELSSGGSNLVQLVIMFALSAGTGPNVLRRNSTYPKKQLSSQTHGRLTLKAYRPPSPIPTLDTPSSAMSFRSSPRLSSFIPVLLARKSKSVWCMRRLERARLLWRKRKQDLTSRRMYVSAIRVE